MVMTINVGNDLNGDDGDVHDNDDGDDDYFLTTE